LFELSAGCTGASEKVLRRANLPYEVLHLHPGSHAGYYPGSEPIAMKVLFCPDTGRILGAQAVGTDGVDKRMDVLATALQQGMKVDALGELELAYAPPFGSAKDPVNMAGLAAQNRLQGTVAFAQWHEVAALDPEHSVVLDVRRADECSRGTIPGAMRIPLDELRARKEELPRDREIVVHCQSGQRSYFACRMLSQDGWKVRNLVGGYRTWKMATGT
jgi:rhodanese-related sulfurtransferase